MADPSTPPNHRRVVIREHSHRLLTAWEGEEGFTVTELVNRAVIELLKREGRWTPPRKVNPTDPPDT